MSGSYDFLLKLASAGGYFPNMVILASYVACHGTNAFLTVMFTGAISLKTLLGQVLARGRRPAS